jgi:NADH-quinone oxidoreductase subunit A
MLAEALTSPFAIYAVAILIGYLLYRWSRSIAPPFIPTPDKTMPYVGGEPAKAQIYQPSYHFFYVALFFTLVHVAGIVLATAPPGAPLWATLGYLALMALGVAVLRWEQ